MSQYLSHSDFWHLQAQKVRLAAQRLEDPEAKADLLANADEYDYLAACNKGKETEVASVIMLPRHVIGSSGGPHRHAPAAH
jgi:hypothetical protein